MTSTSNLADVVRHYQRSIERHGEDETRLLHCITKLFNLPITFEHLQETGIGKTVNALRKINGEVGVAAKTLVTKWKAMVAAEEEPAPQTNKTEEDSNRSNGRRSSEEDQDQENKGSNSSGGEDSRHRHKSKHEERSKNSDHKTKSSSSSSKSHSKSRSESDKKHKSSSHDKSKPKDSDSDRHRKDQKTSSNSEHRKSKESVTKPSSNHHKSSSDGNHHSGSNSSSKQRHHSSHKSEHSKSRHEKSKEQDKSQHSEQKVAKEKSDKHKSSSTSTKSSKRSRSPQRTQDDESPKAKISKIKPKADPVEHKETADEFDSSMGANFDDVLGMLNMPMSSKKITNKLKSPHKPTTITTTSIGSSCSSTKRTTSATTSSSSKLLSTKKPELLAPTAKLEPLDPSIALELPTISNNYKPMPLNQTVMDVVFNHGLGNNAPKAHRNFNESEALAAGISSKTMRTKIYSGVRTGQILQVPSLFDLCTRVLQKNIDALEYTGGVPFDVLRPVLERATPHQLLNFEEYNPYLMEDSEVLWQQHVQRHCRSQRREEMETWREMFLRCEEEKERKLSTIAESIKASQKISEAPVRKTQLAFVDSMVKPPRNVQRKQEQYGTKGKLIATPAARVAALSSVTPNAAKVGDARLRVLSTARDSAQVAAAPMRNKKAPLMAKALQLIRGRHKR
ncbi:transcription elongation factor B polypeptide 3 isoform X1 [Drosophila montana]|uniref:transcription elongation factor B polypeptide 3 isoform X1 n=1 Tax=Drosophila montana TaxID=40370 RepID=UPI00313C7CE8